MPGVKRATNKNAPAVAQIIAKSTRAADVAYPSLFWFSAREGGREEARPGMTLQVSCSFFFALVPLLAIVVSGDWASHGGEARPLVGSKEVFVAELEPDRHARLEHRRSLPSAALIPRSPSSSLSAGQRAPLRARSVTGESPPCGATRGK